ARTRPAPHDWCYVYNFAEPDYPLTIELPAGGGAALARRMDGLIDAARRQLSQAFASDDYRHRRDQIETRELHQRQQIIEQLAETAKKAGFALSVSPTSVVTIPLVDERPMTDEEFARLTAEKKKELHEKAETLREEIDRALGQIQQLEKQRREEIGKLNHDIAAFAIEPLIRDLKSQYTEHPQILGYLDQAREDILNHLDEFRSASEPAGEESVTGRLLRALNAAESESFFDRYKVNVLVSNLGRSAAPVVVEANPTYYNLLGRIEYRARLGVAVTDFRMIKPGALHRANGGYLILYALDVLRQPFAWDALKRTLRTGEIQIENLGEQFSATPTASLRPAPIPLDAKVILIGTPDLYYLLYFLDEEFPRLFKIKADFDTVMDRTPEHLAQYAAFICQQATEKKLLPFEPSALAAIIDAAGRLAEHQRKLTARSSRIADLATEASYRAALANSPRVQAEHVKQAIDAQIERADLIEDKLDELIQEGTLRIETTGQRIGQVNGLSIISLGDYEFGLPVRITAQTSLGHEGILNIERETKLSGPIHSKGFLILSSFLHGQYAQDQPLALAAHLTFEQTYDEVEGDSASSTELYALLSELAEVPLRQDIAVTGSVDQHGEIQPVGGVTRKVEGFYEICRRKGLTGQQGVIIPAANLENLMLRDEVVGAVADGRFHLWAIRHVDEGIQILTGVKAGQRRPDGTWEPGTIHARASDKLAQYATRLQHYAKATVAAPTVLPEPAQVGPRAPRVRRYSEQR
ncbi:MAG TPA: ATP-binding protein, partial [Chloroflexota bacterium]|nr:ATP-binding protein [Chloroflexota bacterium]